MFVTITWSLISRQGSVKRVDWNKRVELNKNVEIDDETTCHNLNLRLATFELRHENGNMLGNVSRFKHTCTNFVREYKEEN
jgi:hypothetical protein